MRLTPERLQEIRSHADSGHYPNHWHAERELLAEIDALRAELKDMNWEYKNCCNFTNDFEEQVFHLKKERDQLKAENETLKKCLFQMQEAAKDLTAQNQKLRERIAKLRGSLLHIREEPNRMGLIADELVEGYGLKAWDDADKALAQDDEMEKKG